MLESTREDDEMQIESGITSPFIVECNKLQSATMREFKSRGLVYLEKPDGKTYVIKRGYVRLAYSDPSGRLWTRMLLGKGAIFGDLPFRPRQFVVNERAIASGMACVVEMRRSEVESVGLSFPQFQALLLQTLSSQVTALDRRLQWQLISPIRNRIATSLYDLMCFSGGRCGHGHLIDVRLTHEEFAELVVAARPVVSAVLAELKSEKVIDYTRGYICLLSLDHLKSIAAACD